MVPAFRSASNKVRTGQRLVFSRKLALAASLLFLAPDAAVCQSSSAFQFSSAPSESGVQPLTLLQAPLNLLSEPIRTETATTIEITLPADVLFDFDKADIRPTAQTALREVADMIRGKAQGPVTIQGYTDALGKDAYNQTLSERRANAVKGWLVTKEGLSPTRLATAGFGPRNPVAPNRKTDNTDDPDGRQLNRRVKLIIRK
jgi:outer membrane protein OmpA-like peptidoglycan-associated protein